MWETDKSHYETVHFYTSLQVFAFWNDHFENIPRKWNYNVLSLMSYFKNRGSSPVLESPRPACFTCLPSPTDLIQMMMIVIGLLQSSLMSWPHEPSKSSHQLTPIMLPGLMQDRVEARGGGRQQNHPGFTTTSKDPGEPAPLFHSQGENHTAPLGSDIRRPLLKKGDHHPQSVNPERQSPSNVAEVN